MKLSFHVFRGLLCLAAGVLLSLMELCFFEHVGVNSLPFLLISILTVSAVFWYFRSEGSVAVPLIYTVALTFLLEALGRQVDVRLLLACLLVLTVLHMQSRLAAAASRPHTGDPAPGLTLLTVLLCGSVVMVSTFRIYRDVLRPNLPEEKRFSLLERRTVPGAPKTARETAQGSAKQSPQSLPTGKKRAALAKSEKGTKKKAPALKTPVRPFPTRRALLTAAAAAACVWLAVNGLRELRYRLWLRKVLASPPERQVAAIYRYLLRAMAVCGYPRRPSETPLEYLGEARGDDIPVSRRQLRSVTEAFLLSQYGGRTILPALREECMAIFRALPGQVKRGRGRKFYYLRYLPGMRRPFAINRRKNLGYLIFQGGESR